MVKLTPEYYWISLPKYWFEKNYGLECFCLSKSQSPLQFVILVNICPKFNLRWYVFNFTYIHEITDKKRRHITRFSYASLINNKITIRVVLCILKMSQIRESFTFQVIYSFSLIVVSCSIAVERKLIKFQKKVIRFTPSSVSLIWKGKVKPCSLGKSWFNAVQLEQLL